MLPNSCWIVHCHYLTTNVHVIPLKPASLPYMSIPARYVSGKAGSAGHAWNEAYEDGRWKSSLRHAPSARMMNNGKFYRS